MWRYQIKSKWWIVTISILNDPRPYYTLLKCRLECFRKQNKFFVADLQNGRTKILLVPVSLVRLDHKGHVCCCRVHSCHVSCPHYRHRLHVTRWRKCTNLVTSLRNRHSWLDAVCWGIFWSVLSPTDCFLTLHRFWHQNIHTRMVASLVDSYGTCHCFPISFWSLVNRRILHLFSKHTECVFTLALDGTSHLLLVVCVLPISNLPRLSITKYWTSNALLLRKVNKNVFSHWNIIKWLDFAFITTKLGKCSARIFLLGLNL